MRNGEKRKLKALSIAQPWAELILRHRKPFELRSWKRDFEGGLLIIHASRKWRAEEPSQLGVAKEEVTFGAFVGVARVKEIRPYTRADASLLKEKGGDTGGYDSKLYAWVLEGVHRLEQPIKFKGVLGLFEPPKRAIEAAQKAMAKANKIARKAVRNRKALAAGTGR